MKKANLNLGPKAVLTVNKIEKMLTPFPRDIRGTILRNVLASPFVSTIAKKTKTIGKGKTVLASKKARNWKAASKVKTTSRSVSARA